MFLLQVSSRRQANREMTCPIFIENLKITFPELETVSHADTLARLLEDIEDVEQIQERMIELLKDNCLKESWEDAQGIMKIEKRNRYECYFGNRHQEYGWANNVPYRYEQNGRKEELFDLVICDEEWNEINRNSGEIKHKKSHYAWLSGKTINK